MATLLEYKCPCCGGAINFDSALQKMKCPFCDTEFDIDTLKSFDEAESSETKEDMSWDTEGNRWEEGEADGIVVYVCGSCGGEVVADENTAASSCPFCGSPVIMSGKLTGDLKPDVIIPFKLDKKAAKEALSKHLEGKRLLPKVFKSENHIDEIKGVYVPFWLFDTDVDADVTFNATKVRSWQDSDYNYTETRHYRIYRSGNIAFERVPVDGSQKMPDDLMESIEPFRYADAVDFKTAYLAGYLADKYDVSSEECVQRANERVKTSTEDAFRGTVSSSYTSVDTERSSIRFSNGKVRYALYPVWLLNTTWKGEKYTFAMNGQTGKFVGNLPVDKGAFAKWYALCAAAASAAVYLISMLLA